MQTIGVDGFLQDRDEIKAATGDADAPLNTFVNQWWARFGSQELAIGSLNYNAIPPTTAGAVNDLVSLLLHYKDEIDLGFNNHKLTSWQTQLGKVLSRGKDKVFDIAEDQTMLSVKLRHRRTKTATAISSCARPQPHRIIPRASRQSVFAELPTSTGGGSLCLRDCGFAAGALGMGRGHLGCRYCSRGYRDDRA